MESYHIMTAWGYEVCKPGFDTLSEAVEKAGEVFSFTFMLGGEEMVLYVEFHDGEKNDVWRRCFTRERPSCLMMWKNEILLKKGKIENED